MTFCNKNTYESNYSRAAACFLSTCAPAPETAEKRAAYDLITGIYTAIFNDVSVASWKCLPDIHFEPWEQQKMRQKDVKNIREPIAKIEGLVKELFDLIEAGEMEENSLVLSDKNIKISRALTKILPLAGVRTQLDDGRIEFPSGSLGALKQLCKISRQHIIPITDGSCEDKAYLYFSRCVFDPTENWTAQAFDRILCADGRLVTLCNEMEKRGYTRIDCRDGKKISLDYVKQVGKKAEPLKTSWADKTHAGIEISYEELRLEPGFLWFRLPFCKQILENADRLPESTAKFLADSIKNCTGCRYCVQTDKTGTRPLAAIKVNNKQKCPLFPSFSMNWRELTPTLLNNIIGAVDALESEWNKI